MNAKSTSVEVKLPTRLGYEKVAMSTAASVAKLMGFREDRIEDLKTAVAEACINAIEHGNRLNDNLSVGVVLNAGDDALEVKVIDDGKFYDVAIREGDVNVPDPGAGGRGRVGCGIERQKQLRPAGDPAGFPR